MRPLLPTLFGVSLALAAVAAPAAAQAGPAVPDATRRTLVVASYNIHHGAGADGVLDLERVATVLEDTGAQVIGLQEVDDHWGERSQWLDQASWLADRLDMHVCYTANLDLDPAAGRTERRRYGTAILSAYPLRNCTSTPLPNHPKGEQRGLSQADVMVRGVPVRFFNTHLTHNSDTGREAQVDVVNQHLAAGTGPTVLVGDMNLRPTAPLYAKLTNRMTDVWTVVGEGPGYTFDSDNPQGRIDYVLVSDDITPLSAKVVPTLASDHMPLVADLALPHPREVHRRH